MQVPLVPSIIVLALPSGPRRLRSTRRIDIPIEFRTLGGIVTGLAAQTTPTTGEHIDLLNTSLNTQFNFYVRIDYSALKETREKV
jgi:hypothetical protein